MQTVLDAYLNLDINEMGISIDSYLLIISTITHQFHIHRQAQLDSISKVFQLT
jgi:hypothetical protein